MDKSGSLESRLDYLEARIEIGDLVAAYGRAVDDRDWQSLGGLYCIDAIFDAVEGPFIGRDRISSTTKNAPQCSESPTTIHTLLKSLK